VAYRFIIPKLLGPLQSYNLGKYWTRVLFWSLTVFLYGMQWELPQPQIITVQNSLAQTHSGSSVPAVEFWE
jgi:hypothetical protein